MSATERREQILRCAIQLFEAAPYAEVSVDAVAACAGVTRALVHHYFGTRRQLYLEAVRRLYTVPDTPRPEPDGPSPDARIAALVERWLNGVWTHRGLWTATVVGPGPVADPDVAEIMREVDHDLARRTLVALGLDDHPRSGVLEGAMIAFAALAKQAGQEWLSQGTLERDDVRRLLNTTLGALVKEFA